MSFNKNNYKTFKVILSKPATGWKQTYMSGFDTEMAAKVEARAVIKKYGSAYAATVVED